MYNDTRCPLDVVESAVGPVNQDDLEIAQLFNGLSISIVCFVYFLCFFLSSNYLRF